MTLVAILAVSCESAKVDSSVSYGKLSVSLTEVEPEIEVSTKSAQLTPQEAANYNVAVYSNKECSGDPVIEALKYSEFGSQTIATGTYYVSAESCNETEAEACEDFPNGQKRLYGVSDAVEVTTDDVAEASVICEVANAHVTVSFDPETIYDGDVCRFENLNVTLQSESKKAEVSHSKTDVQHWFNPNQLTYTITGKFIATDKQVDYSGTYDLDAKSNIKLIVKVNLDNGIIVPSISVQKDITEAEDITQGFNPYE